MLIKQVKLYLDSDEVFCLSKPTYANGFFPDDAFICGGWLTERFEDIPIKMGETILLKVFDKPAPDRIEFKFINYHVDDAFIEGHIEGEDDNDFMSFDKMIDGVKDLIGTTLYLEVQV